MLIKPMLERAHHVPGLTAVAAVDTFDARPAANQNLNPSVSMARRLRRQRRLERADSRACGGWTARMW